MHQLHWGKTKQNQSYIKDRPHKLFGVKGSLLVKGGKQILNFKNPHGFKAGHGMRVELVGLHEHDPKTKQFKSTIREVWNCEPPAVRENVKKIILSGTNPKKLASMDTDTRTIEFCMPEGMKISEYGQIVRHELDHVYLDQIKKNKPSVFHKFVENVKKIPPTTVILESLKMDVDDALKSNQKKKHEVLDEEYTHEFFAETGQYLYQKNHGMEHYNLTNPKAMTEAVKLYHDITKERI